MSSAINVVKQAIPTVSVGILSADLMNLQREIELLENEGVSLVHFDVMDGCFCPMATVGPPFIKGVRTSMLKDVHLMIENPIRKLADYVAAGADILTVHLESCPRHIHRVFQELENMPNANDPSRGLVRGIAINPGTPVEAIEPVLDMVEMVTLLAINPGWSGQRFIEATKDRLHKLKRIVEEKKRNVLICIDGGVTKDNIAEVAKLQVDVVVTGSAVFDGQDPARNIRFVFNVLRTSG
jgi:ribulose-phosphate 3-epimerase